MIDKGMSIPTSKEDLTMIRMICWELELIPDPRGTMIYVLQRMNHEIQQRNDIQPEQAMELFRAIRQ